MGLLDSVLGSVMQNGQAPQAGAQGGLAGMVGMVGMVGMLASNPQLIKAVAEMLGQEGALAGLISKFEQAGLGSVVQSWIGGGPNQAVSGAQITSALGSDFVSEVAGKIGVQPDDAAGQLAQFLPQIINQLTPDGQAPQQGLGSSSDLMGMLGGLVQR